MSEADEEEDAGAAWPVAGELVEDSFFLDDVLGSLVRDNCIAAKQIAAKKLLVIEPLPTPYHMFILVQLWKIQGKHGE